MSFDYEELSLSDIRDLLRKWRETNERRSEEIVELWTTVMQDGDYLQKLGNEKHVLLEQVIFAALDCHNYTIADICMYVLNEEFPGSMRVMRYKAAKLEAQEKYEEALDILDSIIKLDETNAAARKRRVAILKAQGSVTDAIKELVDYLKKFMSDVEGWQELCELYLQCSEYARAAFCAEELLLHQPHNHLAHQRLADIRYTMGGMENLELAKTYYSQALKLNPDNMRAMLGLFLTTNNLLTHYKSSGHSAKRKDACRLCQWAQARATLGQRHARKQDVESQPPPALTYMMNALAITE